MNHCYLCLALGNFRLSMNKKARKSLEVEVCYRIDSSVHSNQIISNKLETLILPENTSKHFDVQKQFQGFCSPS